MIVGWKNKFRVQFLNTISKADPSANATKAKHIKTPNLERIDF